MLQQRHAPRGCARATRGPVILCLSLLLVLFALLLGTAARAEPVVSGLRFGVNEHRTRVVLDLDRAVTYETREQSGPDRLIVDLEEVRWRLGPATDVRPRGLVRAHRHGLLSPGRSRLIVDMARPFRIVGAILLPPSQDSRHHRLVIDVVPVADAQARPAATPQAAAPPLPEPRPEMLAAALTDEAPVNGHEAPVAAPAAPPKPKQLPLIVLDAGHGGIDPGAIAVSGAYEKDIVLEMARELRDLIERTKNYRVALTRDADVFIRLRDRIAKARELGGQIFISLHADSLKLSDQRGASVYTLSETASDEEAARLASKENKADILAGTDLSQHDQVVAGILLDLARRDTNNKSIAFADVLAEEIAKVSPLVRKHRRFAGFAVLKSPDIPSVLLELGYLSNASDAQNLAQRDYRAKLGHAVVRALDRYFVATRP